VGGDVHAAAAARRGAAIAARYRAGPRPPRDPSRPSHRDRGRAPARPRPGPARWRPSTPGYATTAPQSWPTSSLGRPKPGRPRSPRWPVPCTPTRATAFMAGATSWTRRSPRTRCAARGPQPILLAAPRRGLNRPRPRRDRGRRPDHCVARWTAAPPEPGPGAAPLPCARQRSLHRAQDRPGRRCRAGRPAALRAR
jgi:hypothetical protein